MICTPKVRQILKVHILLMGKEGQKKKKYSSEFKTGVILDMREHYMAYRETVRKYFGTTSRSEEDKYKKR